jgi:hypothetical protein
MATGVGNGDLPKALRTVPTATLPPEPIRYLGGLVVRHATARKERAEDLSLKPGKVVKLLAGLDPTASKD